MGRYSRRIAYCAAVTILLNSIITAVVATLPMSVVAATIHAPIRIDGNDEFTSGNGVTGGSGTEADPYVIEGWQINPADTPGIHVSNSTAWLVIYKVTVQGVTPDVDGMRLESCSNVTVSYCSLTGNRIGAALDASSNTTIANSELYGNDLYGISMICPGFGMDSNISIIGNAISDNGYCGITCEGRGGTGVSISRNLISEDSSGIRIHWLHESSIFRNAIINPESSMGIYIACSSNVTISNNTIQCEVHSGTGVSIEEGMGGRYIYVLGNKVSGWSTGVTVNYYYFSEMFLAAIMNNSISGNHRGVYARGGVSTVLGNSFLDNEIHAEIGYLPSSAGAQTTVIWNGTYPVGGNYWDNYTGIDEFSGPLQNEPGGDDIGDSAFVIDGNNTDFYPLMFPIAVVNSPPIAYLEAHPSSGDVMTIFEFNASESWDDGPDDSLEVRWDFDGDGEWETEWSTDKVAYHQYTVPGEYSVRLEVRDTDGLRNTTSLEVVVIEAIPEFSSVIVPILSLLLLIAFTTWRRSKNE